MITPPALNKVINNLPHSVMSADFPLSKINLDKVEGIQKGIALFDDGKSLVPMDDIRLMTHNLTTFNLFRGCDVGCSHCLKDAKPFPKDKQSILFEDIVRFTDGIKALSERFGFNVLQGQKFLSVFDDSNSGDYAIYGLSGKRSLTEALKLLYDKLRIPLVYVTSGWNSKTQATQEEVAKLFTQNLQSLDSYQVSVNPFSGIMENSRKALKSGDIDTANKFRELYTDRISNAIMTFFELFKGEKPKANLIYRHAGDYEGNELVGENEMKKLYSEIYEKMKKVLGDRLTEAPTLLPEVVTKFKKSHLIEPTGRARRYFPYDYNLEVQSGLIKEVEKWDSMTPAQQREFLRLYSMKGVDINGKVYAIYPAIDVPHENAYVEIAAPTGIQLNFINRPNVPKIFSDIEV